MSSGGGGGHQHSPYIESALSHVVLEDFEVHSSWPSQEDL